MSRENTQKYTILLARGDYQMSKRASKQHNSYKNLKKSAWKTITKSMREGKQNDILHSVPEQK